MSIYSMYISTILNANLMYGLKFIKLILTVSVSHSVRILPFSDISEDGPCTFFYRAVSTL